MLGIKRLQVEYRRLSIDPIPLAIAKPVESDIHEWRFVIKGIEEYSGGYYQGKLIFPNEYPLKPPSIIFLTPSGRFKTNKRICLSISDYHPETWTPSWNVGTILTGIVSFMNCSETSVGTLNYSSQEKRDLANQSREYNLRDPQFIELFGKNFEELFNICVIK